MCFLFSSSPHGAPSHAERTSPHSRTLFFVDSDNLLLIIFFFGMKNMLRKAALIRVVISVLPYFTGSGCVFINKTIQSKHE
jgi:hypothetical protein